MSTSVKAPTAPSAPAPATTPEAVSNTEVSTANYRLPEKATLENAVKWAIIEDRPIMMDYWADSLEKKVMIGVRETQDGPDGAKTQEKLLVKNPKEYTSPIAKIFKHNADYIVMTENSIYLVDSTIPIRRIS